MAVHCQNLQCHLVGHLYHMLQAKPSTALVAQVLDFLQDSLDRVLTPSTIKRQAAALSSVLSIGKLGVPFQASHGA